MQLQFPVDHQKETKIAALMQFNFDDSCYILTVKRAQTTWSHGRHLRVWLYEYGRVLVCVCLLRLHCCSQQLFSNCALFNVRCVSLSLLDYFYTFLLVSAGLAAFTIFDLCFIVVSHTYFIWTKNKFYRKNCKTIWKNKYLQLLRTHTTV